MYVCAVLLCQCASVGCGQAAGGGSKGSASKGSEGGRNNFEGQTGGGGNEGKDMGVKAKSNLGAEREEVGEEIQLEAVEKLYVGEGRESRGNRVQDSGILKLL